MIKKIKDCKKSVKIFIVFMTLILVLCGMTLVGIKVHRVRLARQSGILLAFDDYNPDNWSIYFDFFEENNVHVTYFVTLSQPTEFCYEAIQRGHEIAFHTTSHNNVIELTDEEIKEKVIDPIETFRSEGIELTSFAYPYGLRSNELDEKLLEYYNVVRGAYYYELHSKADLRKGYIDAYSIDNTHFGNDADYKNSIDNKLIELNENVGAVACFYSHAIGGGDWCVTKEHLQYLFDKANELGLKFYTFNELQKD